jgi:hypothetical protein
LCAGVRQLKSAAAFGEARYLNEISMTPKTETKTPGQTEAAGHQLVSSSLSFTTTLAAGPAGDRILAFSSRLGISFLLLHPKPK